MEHNQWTTIHDTVQYLYDPNERVTEGTTIYGVLHFKSLISEHMGRTLLYLEDLSDPTYDMRECVNIRARDFKWAIDRELANS